MPTRFGPPRSRVGSATTAAGGRSWSRRTPGFSTVDLALEPGYLRVSREC